MCHDRSIRRKSANVTYSVDLVSSSPSMRNDSSKVKRLVDRISQKSVVSPSPCPSTVSKKADNRWSETQVASLGDDDDPDVLEKRQPSEPCEFPFHWWNQNTSMFLSVPSYEMPFFWCFSHKKHHFWWCFGSLGWRTGKTTAVRAMWAENEEYRNYIDYQFATWTVNLSVSNKWFSRSTSGAENHRHCSRRTKSSSSRARRPRSSRFRFATDRRSSNDRL